MPARRKEAVAAVVVLGLLLVAGWLLRGLAGGDAAARGGSPDGEARPSLTPGSGAVNGADEPRSDPTPRPNPDEDGGGTAAKDPASKRDPVATKTSRRPEPWEERTPSAGAPLGVVEGRVVDGRGAPVADVDVGLLGLAHTRSARSDAQGRFRFAQVPLGRYVLQPAQPRTPSNRPVIRIPRDRAVARVELVIGEAVSLRFEPPPRAGDRVLMTLAEGNGREQAVLKAGEALSDLYVGRWDLAYLATDGRVAAQRVEVRPGPNVVRLDLRGPGTVEVDARDLAGERVEVEVKLLPLTVRTALRGPKALGWIERTTFTLRRQRAIRVPAGRYLLTAVPVRGAQAPASVEVEVEAEQALRVPLQLRPAATVEVALAQPWRTGTVVYGPRGWRVVEPTQAGQPLRIEGIADDARGTLLVWDRAHPARAGTVELSPGARPVLRLDPIGGLRVRVADAGAGLPVEVRLVGPVRLSVSPPAGWRPGTPGALILRGHTDAAGTARFVVPPGTWVVAAGGEQAEARVGLGATAEVRLELDAEGQR